MQANQAGGGGVASTGMSVCDLKEKQDCSREIKQGKQRFLLMKALTGLT